MFRDVHQKHYIETKQFYLKNIDVRPEDELRQRLFVLVQLAQEYNCPILVGSTSRYLTIKDINEEHYKKDILVIDVVTCDVNC